MATQVQLRRGNTSQTNAFTGAVAEITVDTDKETVVVHDGSTAGGFPLARESALSANLAFTQAAFNLANTANIKIDSGYAFANTVNIKTDAAFTKANAANVLAQAAFDKANTGLANTGTSVTANGLTQYTFANTTVSTSNTTGALIVSGGVGVKGSIYADAIYDGGVEVISFANQAFNLANTANIKIDSGYAFANTVNIKVDAAFSFSNTVNIKTDAAFSKANAANVLAQAAFDKANTANVTAEAGFGRANSANILAQAAFNQANTANVTAQAAFNKANNALANTGGSISGDLTITGNLTIVGQQVYANTQTVLIKDNIITLNAAINQAAAPSANAGLEIDRGSSANVYLLWNENSDVWQFTNDGTTYYTIADTTTLSSAFDKANTANVTAETGFSKANAANVLAQAAFNQANTTNVTAEAAFARANTANITADAAFTRANAANVLAQAAFNQANTANIKIDSGYAFANIVNIKVDSAFAFSNTVNIKVDSAFAFSNTVNIKTDAAFVKANAANVLAQAAFDKANASLANTGTSVTANGLTVYTFANTTVSTSNTTGAVVISGGLGVAGNVYANAVYTNNLTINGTLTPTLTANGNVSSYASKHFVEYNPTTKALTYSSTPDASSPYITGYSQEIHVSPVAFNDSGKGTIGDPVKTIARAIQLISPAFETTGAGQRKTIILHPGDYAENVTINTQYTVLTTHELIGKSTTLSGTLTLTTGCTIDGLKMTNLVISGTSANGSVDIIGCTVTTSTTKTSSAYTNFRGCDLSSSTLSITGTGTVVMVGGNYFTTTVNNAAASVLAKAVVSMGPVTLTAGTLQLSDTLVYAASNTSNAITQSVGSVLTLNNSQTLIPDLTNVARNSFGGFYSILHSVFDRANSTFGGTSLSAISYNQVISAEKINLTATTASTSNLTGTLIVAGGIGVKGNVSANGIIFDDGTRQTTAASGGGASLEDVLALSIALG